MMEKELLSQLMEMTKQLSEITSQLQELSFQNRLLREENEKKYKKIYPLLGVMLGVSAVIIII